MIKIVQTNIFWKEYETGGSHPCLFDCSDGRKYVIKHEGNQKRTKHLINELIAVQIANEIGLNVPEFALVEINDKLFEAGENFRGGKPNGIGFGSLLLEKTKNLNELENINVGNTVNGESIASTFLKLIILDIWLRNDDRGIGNPNTLIQEVGRKFRMIAIDHAAIFAQQDYQKLESEIDESPTIEDTLIQHTLFEKVIKYFGLFFEQEIDKIVERIKKVDEGKIEEILENIPIEWDLKKDAKINIKNFIIKRKSLLKQQTLCIIKDAREII